MTTRQQPAGLKAAVVWAALALAALGAGVPAAERGPGPLPTARLAHCPTGSSCETGGGNSFAPDTAVLLADGGRVAIGAVRAGDLVLATDPRTGESSPQPVRGVLTGRGTKHLVAVALAAGAGGAPPAPLVATGGHPFYVAGRGWTAARALAAGDRLAGPGGRAAAVLRIDDLGPRPGATVVNLAVAGPGTFSVAAGGVAVLARAAAAPAGTADAGELPGPARIGDVDDALVGERVGPAGAPGETETADGAAGSVTVVLLRGRWRWRTRGPRPPRSRGWPRAGRDWARRRRAGRG